jgi:alkyldihydroxyacetonephosphate synthase
MAELSTPATAVISQLNDAFGPLVSTDDDDLLAHSHDWWPLLAKSLPAERLARLPLAVVRPKTRADVSRVLAFATERNLPVVPFGAGSGVTGASVPAVPAVSLDMQELNSVIRFEAENLCITVEAGMKGGVLESWLNERNLTLGHYPQSLHISTVGGWVSTTASGTFSTKYGGIENLVLGLEIVLMSGETLTFRPVPRAANGPRLMQLFIGAEGSLGVVTTVTLKVFPLPAERGVIAFAPPTIEDGVVTIRRFFECHLQPALVRLYDEVEAAPLFSSIGQSSGRPLLLLCCEGLPSIVRAEAEALTKIATDDGADLVDAAIVRHWESGRYNAEWYAIGNAGAGKIADSIEVSACWSELAPLYRDVMAAIAPICTKSMGHVSHCYSTGASIYFICFLEHEDAATLRQNYETLWSTIMDKTLAHGGSISHHHGIGLARAGTLRRELGAVHGLLQTIKDAVDPQGLLNPAKLGLR